MPNPFSLLSESRIIADDTDYADFKMSFCRTIASISVLKMPSTKAYESLMSKLYTPVNRINLTEISETKNEGFHPPQPISPLVPVYPPI